MPTTTEVLDEWYLRVCVTQRAHYLSAGHFSRKKYWLGIPAVILTTFVGTTVFTTLSGPPNPPPEPWLQIAIGFASVAAALLTSLQTFLGYSERAEKHRLAGAKYGALGREMEELRVETELLTPEQTKGVRLKLDVLAIESPDNPPPIYYKAGAASLHAPGPPPNSR